MGGGSSHADKNNDKILRTSGRGHSAAYWLCKLKILVRCTNYTHMF